jgi:hypothetical protein
MTVTVTDHFGFIGVYNAVPSTNDWACTYWNWLAADEIIYGLVSHQHDGAAALQSPTGTLALSTADSAGYLPAATTYYIAVTYLDDILRETAASTVATVTTGTGISRPATPTINDDATPTDIQECPGGLTGGDYWYKISYVKDGGETLPSLPVYVSIPTDTTYECTIHFASLNDVGNGADAIYVYRKSGNTGSYVKLAEITSGSAASYTDNNTGVPTCDKSPVTSSTINSCHTVTIDWSSLDFSEAYKVRIYATTTDGTYPTNALVAEVTMNDATPVTSYIWTGTARTAGKPPEITHCYPNPSKINLATETQGNLPWANLPSDFSWQEPVATYASLPAGNTGGEARVVEDENSIYVWDENASTPEWVKVAGLKEVEEYADLPASGTDAYLVTNEGDIYIWSDYATAWNQVGKKVLVIDSNPIDWTEVDSVPGVAHGDFLLATIEGSGGSRDKLAGLYTWRGDWATPAWQLLNTFLPPDFGNSNNYGDVPDGCAWLDENYAEDGMTFYYRYAGGNYSFPLDVEYIATYNGYYGWYDEAVELDFEPDYGYGAIAFIWEDKSFYYYDDEIATPAWVRGPGVVKLDTTIDDVVEDATPTPEQLKINEILEALRNSGLIGT